MSQDNQPVVDGLAALQQDLTQEDTTFPILEPGVVDCIISDIKPVASKSTAGGANLQITLKTSIPYKDRAGVIKAPGFPLRDLVSLVATEKYNPKQRLAQIKEAVFGEHTGAFGSPEVYIGKPVTVRIKIESNEQFGDQNRIAAYVKKAAA